MSELKLRLPKNRASSEFRSIARSAKATLTAAAQRSRDGGQARRNSSGDAKLRLPIVSCAIALALSALLLVVPGASAQQLTPEQTARAKAISLKVKCMCGGCNDPAGACYHSGGTFSGPCDMALSEIKLVNEKVAKGESDDAILKDFVAQYGPTVLIAPPKSGFDLTAWVVPVLVPLIALVLVWEVARRWRQKHPVAAATASASQIPAEMLARVQHDIEKDER